MLGSTYGVVLFKKGVNLIKAKVFLLIILFFTFNLPTALADEFNLEEEIKRALPHETIEIPDGHYELSLIINKPIKLSGSKDVVFTAKDDAPVFTIISDDVTLSGFTIKSTIDDPDHSEILVLGNYNLLTDLRIETHAYAVRLNKAHYNQLNNLTIKGNQAVNFGQRQNGIDLWGAHFNEIKQSRFSYLQDGVYIESSKYNKISGNKATQSRYGYHLMFTEETELESNESYQNISGMMVMGTKQTQVKNNTLMYNNEGVQALGLLLYDVEGAVVEKNRIAENRIGIFIEDTIDSSLSFNDLQRNYVGLQFKNASKNELLNNSLIANVVQGQADRSADNITNENYWGDHLGLDFSGDGFSDIPYTVDPFFLTLTDSYPPFQLLFQAPGMIFLEQLLHTPTEQWLVDKSPLMKEAVRADRTTKSDSTIVLIFSLFLLSISLFTITMGVKQR